MALFAFTSPRGSTPEPSFRVIPCNASLRDSAEVHEWLKGHLYRVVRSPDDCAGEIEPHRAPQRQCRPAVSV
ncbi:MAG: hypothetical protein OXE85_01590 [Roseovarius sp.]|nr:hypothetical protein [Roseovarius sp.]